MRALRRAAAESEARGKLRGLGVSSTVEASNAGLIEHAEIRFDPTGTVTVSVGTHDHGQGHATTFRQIIADRLGLAPDHIRFNYGDTDQIAIGTGTFGSRSTIAAGTAMIIAAEKIIAKGRRIAAHLMEADEHDIVFERGRFVVAGTDKAVDLVAGRARRLRAGEAAARHRARPVRDRHLQRRRAHLSERLPHQRGRDRPRDRRGRRSCATPRSTMSAT